MKKINSIICAAGLVLSLGLFASCNQDKDESWKSIPSKEITTESGNATLTINEVAAENASATLKATSLTAGTLTLTGAVPGFQTVAVPVTLTKVSDAEFSFEGGCNLGQPKPIELKSEMIVAPFTITVNGTATTDGKLTVTAATSVSEKAQAGLAGTWNLLRKVTTTEEGRLENGPIFLKWTTNDDHNANVANVASLAGVFGGGFVADALDQITLHEDGNITAKYWDEPEMVGPETDEATNTATFGNSHKDEWLESEKDNEVFWYTLDNMIYVVPIIDTDDEEGETTEISMEELNKVIAQLKQYGVDTDALTRELAVIMQRGFALKYETVDGALKVYADKELCDPFAKALLPALPALDAMLPSLIEGNETAAMIVGMVKGMLGIENLAELADIWGATTEFEIALNLVK